MALNHYVARIRRLTRQNALLIFKFASSNKQLAYVNAMALHHAVVFILKT
jgi:hypothetical protein